MRRIAYIDYGKAIGIIVMIVGHIALNTNLPAWVSHYIHAWHMPIFFLLSGILWKDIEAGNGKKFIGRKISTLLVPYFVWGIVSWIIYIGFNAFSSKENLDKALNSIYYVLTYNTEFFPINGAMWFLTAMFAAQMMYVAICFIARNNLLVKGIGVTVAAGIAWYLTTILEVRLVWGIDSAMAALPFMYLGNVIRIKVLDNEKWKKRTDNPSFLLIGMGLVISIFGIFQNAEVNLRTLKYGNVFLFYLNACISCLAILALAKKLDKIWKNRMLTYIGRSSICFLIFNQLILAFTYRIFDKLFAVEYVWAETIISLVIVLIACGVINEIVKRFFPMLLGYTKSNTYI